MTIGVQVFQSSDQGASTAANTAGSRITNIFDPVLLNGYNSLSVSSITRSGSTVTVTTSSAHGYPTSGAFAYAYLTIAGATQPDYNGTWKCTPTGTTTLTFNIGALTPTTPATGTITIKRASAGWTKPYTGTNKAAYLSPDGKCYIRVDDSATTGPTIRVFRTMSDVDTGTDPCPTVAQGASGSFWNFSASGVPWVLTYKDNFVNFWCGLNSSSPYASGQLLHIGKLVDQRAAGDDWAYVNRGGVATGARQEQATWSAIGTAGTGCFLMRSYTAASGAVTAGLVAPKGSQNGGLMGASGTQVPPYPHTPDSTLIYDYADIAESAILVFRGRMPGVRVPAGNLVASIGAFDTIDGTGVDAGKTFLALHIQSVACVLFEVTDSTDW